MGQKCMACIGREISLSTVVLIVGIAMKNYGFRNFTLLKTTLQQALAKKRISTAVIRLYLC